MMEARSVEEVLPVYYKYLFPFDLYWKWLSYGKESYIAKREFCFTLRDDIYIRYNSFSSLAELETEIQRKNPLKIDIGAVYSHKPSEHKSLSAGTFVAKEKELVFDIDMTDYDDVRGCCHGAEICDRCWPVMRMAAAVIDASLREDFGFRHRLWVYSGRRGIHCWVADPEARRLPANARSAIVEYLTLVRSATSNGCRVRIDYLHPSVRRACDIIATDWPNYCLEKQELMGEKRFPEILSLITETKVADYIEKYLKQKVTDNPKEKWNIFETAVRKMAVGPHSSFNLEEIMLHYCYPRLDANVSTSLNHLLKSPFCVHPKTGRVCVPFDPEDTEFDPASVPTVGELCAELDSFEALRSNDKEVGTRGEKVRWYKKTRMAKSIRIFVGFLEDLYKEINSGKRKTSENSMEW